MGIIEKADMRYVQLAAPESDAGYTQFPASAIPANSKIHGPREQIRVFP
jgi:hypothetical protein